MKQQPDRGFADAISQVARALQAEPSAQDTLQKMVALAVETIGGYDHAGVTIIDGQVSTPAATGDVPRQVDQIQYDTDQGPCLEAIRSHRTYVTDPVYAPNSYGGPTAQPERTDDGGLWYADGEMVRAAYTLRAEDDDWGQAGTMVREVLDDAGRERLVTNIVGHLLNGVSELVLDRAFEYWRNVDKNLGDRIEAGVRAKQDEKDPKAAEQANPARSSMQAKA